MLRRARFATLLLATALFVGCGGDTGTAVDKPVETPMTPAPVIALSSESVTTTLSTGTDGATYDITISAGNTAALTGITVENISASSTQPWLSFALSGSSAPARLTLTLVPVGSQAETLSALLRITAAGAQPRLFSIVAVVSPLHPTLILERSELTLPVEPGSFVPRSSLTVSSINGTVGNLSLSPISCGNGPSRWLSVDLDGLQTPATVGATVDATGLTPGQYTCSFSVSTSQALVQQASQSITVTLDVHFIPRIAFSVLVVNINGVSGRSPPPLAIIVSNSSAGGVLDKLSLGTTSYSGDGAGWLSTSLSKTDAPSILVLGASAAQLGPGTYKALVPVLSAARDVGNSPAVLEVNFFVSPATAPLLGAPR